jgi:hypothetical protein
MKKIILKKKRIIINKLNNNNNNLNQRNTGIIFLKSLNKIYNTKKLIYTNNTKILLKNNKFMIYNNNNLDSIINDYKINSNNIIHKIHIYNKNNLDLYIVILNDFTSLTKKYKIQNYIDLFNKNIYTINNSIYESILKSNNIKNNYLYSKIKSSDNLVEITIKDIYYYIIGYV